ncbi:LpqB family beta-propeller domain-containing protein [Actinotalea caeni]|uniref:LpqB family beta-propeller domain-containing protein n=1 Tax=Actinotalea caeni TaxID=1348467 RepID=UPI0012E22405|nr:LpqB family beta-propeller domain-containing protein [Actinotalea caeni]
MSARPDLRGRRGVAALCVAALLTLAGCLSLPVEGGVQVGLDRPPADGGLEIVAPGPSVDAAPREIVEGFLLASSLGLGDDFHRAYEFMTTAGASQWDPLGGVTIYSDDEPPTIEVGDEGADGLGVVVTVTVPVAATVGEDGTYTEAPPDTVQPFRFHLVKVVDDQWRISQLDPGVLMSEVTFGTQYREVSVYFLSSDAVPRLVPDLRWVPRARSVTAAVRALLGGPAEWLTAPAVVSAFPDGTTLGIEGVEIDDRVATVSLSQQFLDASAADRAYARAQLTETLRQLGQVSRVEISVDGNLLTLDPTLAPVDPAPAPLRGPTVLTEDGLGVVNGDQVSPVDAVVPDGVSDLAVPYGREPVVGLVDSRSLVTLGDGATLLPPDGSLVPPSYDAQGWVWTGPTGPGSNEGSLLVVDPVSGATETVSAPDLAGADVVALRVSREGSRLAYALRTDESIVVHVAAVLRDADGRPTAIGPGRAVGGPLLQLRDLVWVGEVRLAVLAQTATIDLTVLLVGVGGQTVPLPSVEGAASIAAGDGPRELVLVTAGGDLYGRSGNGWRMILPGVSSPAFAG